MAKGFKDDSGKFRPISKTGVGKSKREKTVSSGKGKLITSRRGSVVFRTRAAWPVEMGYSNWDPPSGDG